ncbi:MAG TPA: GTPase HflX [Calditrichaeota bacterium]|nr:GTPase HflX [Calditrichota bacterium]
MIETFNNNFRETPERAIIIGLIRKKDSRWEVLDHLDELRALAQTSGAEVVEAFVQARTAPDPAYFIGRGKVEEIAEFIEFNDIDLIIFDDELSPAQIKNIEQILKIKVIDRSTVILDIFADHARTNESKVQVELAQLNYLLPRLTRQWQHLSRQVGGIGTKGPGETQLETDRRLIRNRISHLKQKLQKIDHHNTVQRQKRKDLFRAALVGYTNTGKSTLMNSLTKAEIVTEDKLFATLDTTVRRLQLDKDKLILLSDTVGFIRKLPHHLVASFRTTLAESLEADLLLHVVDVSHPNFEEQIAVVRELLTQLKIEKKDRLLVFNKVDLIKKEGLLTRLKKAYPQAVFISAEKGLGLKTLKQRLAQIIEDLYEVKQIRVNYAHGSPEHLIHPLAQIIEKKYDEHYLYLKLKFPKENEVKIMSIASQYQ